MKKLFEGRKRLITIPLALILGLIFLPITIGLLLAWLAYTKVGNKPLKIASISVIGLLTLFFGSVYIAAFVSPSSPSLKQVEITPQPSVAGQQTEVTSPTPTSIPESPTPSLNLEMVKVTRVIDGDTIEIEGGSRVRYIGIDTPETVDPRKPVQCFGQEASNKNKELVEGKTVGLEKDVSETDKYDRLLRYVYVGNTLINELLVREGYAQSSSYPPDVKYQDRFVAAQKEARDNNRGLWAACAATSTPTPKPTTPPQSSTSTGSGSCKYSCSSPDRDCADFSTHAEAQAFFNCCGFTATYDPMRLDSVGVGDGVACESLP